MGVSQACAHAAAPAGSVRPALSFGSDVVISHGVGAPGAPKATDVSPPSGPMRRTGRPNSSKRTTSFGRARSVTGAYPNPDQNRGSQRSTTCPLLS